MLGEVEAGIRYWRNLTLRDFQNAAYYSAIGEARFAASVRNDQRYLDLRNELGIGSEWTAYMRERVRELTPITGIPVADEQQPVHEFWKKRDQRMASGSTSTTHGRGS